MIDNSPAITGNSRDAKGRFNAGFSGNPQGKKKGTKSISSMLKNIGNETGPGEFTNLELVCRIIWHEALNGERWAIRELFDRMEGKLKAKELEPVDVACDGFITKRI